MRDPHCSPTTYSAEHPSPLQHKAFGKKLRLYLDAGGDVNASLSDGLTLLAAACSYNVNAPRCAALLLEAGALAQLAQLDPHQGSDEFKTDAVYRAMITATGNEMTAIFTRVLWLHEQQLATFTPPLPLELSPRAHLGPNHPSNH